MAGGEGGEAQEAFGGGLCPTEWPFHLFLRGFGAARPVRAAEKVEFETALAALGTAREWLCTRLRLYILARVLFERPGDKPSSHVGRLKERHNVQLRPRSAKKVEVQWSQAACFASFAGWRTALGACHAGGTIAFAFSQALNRT